MIVWFYYTRLVKYIIHKAKYGWAYHLFSYFAQKIALLLRLHITSTYPEYDIIITYIPMHYKKEYYQRWYNQAQKLAEYIAINTNSSCIPLLKKTHSTKAQMKKNRKERQKTSEQNYEIIPTYISPNTIIILVDDVVTTWSTLNSTSKVIKEYFPENIVRWVCIARNT
jgi:competence protein ComFC